MQIATIILAICFMLLALWGWVLAARIDELTDAVGNMALAVSQAQDDIKALQTSDDALREMYKGAEELIDAAKEAADEQTQLEKEFREGLKNILNY